MKKSYTSPYIKYIEMVDIILVSGAKIDGKTASFLPTEGTTQEPNVDGKSTGFNWNW